jgi:hypothetical protein
MPRVLLFTLFPLIGLFGLGCSKELAPTEPVPQSVYVWQREWSSSVTNALLAHSAVFERCIVLNAEISWSHGDPQTLLVPLNFEALRQRRRPVGLALRIGEFRGSFTSGSPASAKVQEAASNIIHRARAENVAISELHVDFDCAESKLAGYAEWIASLRHSFPDVPITITVLPSWLKQPNAFQRLIEPLDSYVLQVHSLARPKAIGDPVQLCDPQLARKAIFEAAPFGKPFLVALPTYSYLLAFDEDGQFAGLQAESAARVQGNRGTIRKLGAPPNVMAGLVRNLNTNRPAALAGIIWYRLPVASDSLNWSWPTLAAVMRGEEPKPQLTVETRSPRPSLYEIFLQNIGTDEYDAPLSVAVNYGEGTLLASDALAGFKLLNNSPRQLVLESPANFPALTPGAERKIGWFRTTEPLPPPIESQFIDRKN